MRLPTLLSVLLSFSIAHTALAQSWRPPAPSERCPSKWGADDERGAANHVTAAQVLRAVRLIRTGEIVELGTSARWTLTFAQPLIVPDAEGHPFRVDVAIRDPDVPAPSFAYYRHVNRLVRVDATIEHPTEIYLLPERATNVFNPPAVAGRTMVIQVPGRTLTADEEQTGTSPGLESLRWTVIVRDGRVLYADDDHLSVFGAQSIAGLFAPVFDDSVRSTMR